LKGPISQLDGGNSGLFRMLCFRQVATKTQVRAEDYLRMTFEHDAEFVHGDIVERKMPDYIHGRIEYLLSFEFGRVAQVHSLYPCIEVRMKVAPDTYRIPDFAVFAGSSPGQRVPETPPLVVVEIVSQDDRHVDLMQKLEEYHAWGVPNVWVIDPQTRRFSVYAELGLHNVPSFSLSQYSLQLAATELFQNI
jgi:Uma2 family endonuclease